MPKDERSRLGEHLPLNSETEHLSSEIWPPNVELSFHQAHCSCQNLSYITAVLELILRQRTPR